MTLLAFLILLGLIAGVLVHEWNGWNEKKENQKDEKSLPSSTAKIKPSNPQRVHTATQTIVRKCVVDCDRCGNGYLVGLVHIITPEGSGWIECPLCNGTRQRKVTVKFCASCGKMLGACTCAGV